MNKPDKKRKEKIPMIEVGIEQCKKCYGINVMGNEIRHMKWCKPTQPDKKKTKKLKYPFRGAAGVFSAEIDPYEEKCICKKIWGGKWAIGNPDCKIHYPEQPKNESWEDEFDKKFKVMDKSHFKGQKGKVYFGYEKDIKQFIAQELANQKSKSVIEQDLCYKSGWEDGRRVQKKELIEGVEGMKGKYVDNFSGSPSYKACAKQVVDDVLQAIKKK